MPTTTGNPIRPKLKDTITSMGVLPFGLRRSLSVYNSVDLYPLLIKTEDIKKFSPSTYLGDYLLRNGRMES